MATNTTPISQLPVGTALVGTEVIPVVQGGQTVKIPATVLKGQKGDTGAKGDPGDPGIPGIKGDTGGVGPKGDVGLKGDQGLQGLQGDKGADGKDGKDGTSIRLLGEKPSFDDLPIEDNLAGDTWFVNGSGYTWDATNAMWKVIGSFSGADGVSVDIIGLYAAVGLLPPAGDNKNALASVGSHLYGCDGVEWKDLGDLRGPQGLGLTPMGELPTTNDLPPASQSNLSQVYTIAGTMYVSDGSTWKNMGNFIGPKGDKGDTGNVGPKGEQGIQGIPGPKGNDGLGIKMIDKLDDVTQLPQPADYNQGDTFVIKGHYWTLYDGAWVDLGDMSGPQGKSNYDLWLADGNEGTVQDYLNAQKGADGIGLQIRGSFPAVGDLPITGMVNGDAYIIQQQMHVWDGTQWSIVGQVGPKGDKGDVGPQGNTGSKGDQGIQGIKGDTGEKGDTGDVGAKGDKGDQGIQGLQGEKGETGLKGDQGIQGIQGEKGDMGPGITILGRLDSTAELPASAELGQGFLIAGDFYGWDGDSFENMGPIQGPKGDKGEKGDVGAKGEQGEQGIQGLQGTKGDTGEKGDQGIQGIQGNTGASLTPKGPIINAAALPAAAPGNAGWMYVTIDDKHSHVSDGTAWVDYGDFSGARGADGLKGDQGLQGDTGLKGDKGDTGAGVIAKGSVANSAALPAPAIGNIGWYFTTADNKHSWISNGVSWVDCGDMSGAKGDIGLQGSTGERGVGVVAKGTVANAAALPAPSVDNQGWYYIALDTKHSHLSNGSDWVDLGDFSGAKGDKGDKGDTGAKGDTGDTGLKGDQGLQGLQGLQGDQGEQGPKGDSISFKGHHDIVDDLPMADNVINDTWAVGTEFYYWDGAAWKLLGDFAGPQGDVGPQGVMGAGIKILGKKNTEGDLPATADNAGDGYMIGINFWVWDSTAFVNVGPIQGPKGDTGARGLTGAKGDVGDKGNKGDKGDTGTKWIVFARDPNVADGVIGDYFLNSATQDFWQKTSTVLWSSLGKLGGGNVYDAAHDGKRKVRLDGNWVDLVFDFDGYDLALVSPASTTLDFALGNGFKLSATASKALTITNLPGANRIATIIVVLEGKGGNITFTNSIQWSRAEEVILGDTRTIITLFWDGAHLTGQVGMTV